MATARAAPIQRTMSGSGSWDAADTSGLQGGGAYGLDPYAESAETVEYDPFESPDYVNDGCACGAAAAPPAVPRLTPPPWFPSAPRRGFPQLPPSSRR